MQFSATVLQVLAIATVALAIPTSTLQEDATPAFAVEKRATSGHYTVSGLGARKKAVTAAGGNTLDLAIAMLETDTMKADYTYGDGKTYDSANFGIMKQNWGMLRVCASQFKGQTSAQYNNGAVLNSNLGEDITARHQCYAYYGETKWFGGQRDGSAGLANPSTTDINNYKNAVLWIQSQLTGTYLTDDTRFWVTVPAI